MTPTRSVVKHRVNGKSDGKGKVALGGPCSGQNGGVRTRDWGVPTEQQRVWGLLAGVTPQGHPNAFPDLDRQGGSTP